MKERRTVLKKFLVTKTEDKIIEKKSLNYDTQSQMFRAKILRGKK